MSCLTAFLNKPIMIQLKNPIGASISMSEEELEGGAKCGAASLCFAQKPGGPNEPVILQFIRGSMESFDEKFAIVATLGGDDKTPVRMCVVLDNVANITFCVEHVPLPVQPQIIVPRSH